jgi:hypothetical protein
MWRRRLGLRTNRRPRQFLKRAAEGACSTSILVPNLPLGKIVRCAFPPYNSYPPKTIRITGRTGFQPVRARAGCPCYRGHKTPVPSLTAPPPTPCFGSTGFQPVLHRQDACAPGLFPNPRRGAPACAPEIEGGHLDPPLQGVGRGSGGRGGERPFPRSFLQRGFSCVIPGSD